MTRTTNNLIREILLLYVKYGSDAFEEASETLRQGRVSEVIVSGMRELSHAMQEQNQLTAGLREDRIAKRSSSKEVVHNYISTLLSLKEDNANSVGKFIQEIVQRTVLSSPSLLRNYIEINGIPSLNARADRYSIARRIGEYLMELPSEDVEKKITEGRGMTKSKSSLEAWTNVIVKTEPEK